MIRVDHREFAGGALMAIIGCAFAIASVRGLEIGTAFRMGPGYFPVVLGSLLSVLGLSQMAAAARLRSASVAPIPWRGVFFTCLGPVLFGMTVRGLGLAPALTLATVAAAVASPEVGARRLVLTVTGITLFCLLVFYVGLDLPIVLIGPWLGEY